jgi:hypothetical protein
MAEITDAMVEAARTAFWATENSSNPLRAALEAAEAARVEDYRKMRNDLKERFPKTLGYLAASPSSPVPAEAKARPGEEYHEDMGNMLWWKFPINEPPYAGRPGDTDWPGYHTHFTPIPIPTPPEGE